MTIGKKIPKPANWQDFEKLCRKLYGEMLDCGTTIVANGRAGQAQHGVDIYGIANGQTAYFGVQCKGKDEELCSELSPSEVDDEILKAHSFNPSLKHFYIATTANKDAKIEEHVRVKNLESISSGRFAVTLHCWEDLAGFIEENRNTYNWWVREKRHKEKFALEVSFAESAKEFTIRPKFRRITTSRAWDGDGQLHWVSRPPAEKQRGSSASDPRRSLSFALIDIVCRNSGQEVIEDYRLEFHVAGFGHRFADSRGAAAALPSSLRVDDVEVAYSPRDRLPLTQGDSRRLAFLLRPNPEATFVDFRWSLFARDFSTSGILRVNVKAEFTDETRTFTVRSAREASTTQSIEDIWVDDVM